MVRRRDDSSIVLSLGEIFDVLVAPRRRAVLYTIHGRSEAISLNDLAAAVSATETANSTTVEGKREDATKLPETEASTSREAVALTLDHIHLPKLQQVGLIDYDRNERSIEVNGIPRQFERYLRFAAEDEHRTRAIDATV